MLISSLSRFCLNTQHYSTKLCTNTTLILKSHQLRGCRLLYTGANLGLEKFESYRKRTHIQFSNGTDTFKENMSKSLINPEKTIVFMEDLKNMIYLTETESDTELLLDMAKKYHQQHRGVRFGSFTYGPEMMRLFHWLNQPDAAKKALEMKELEGFFDQMVSYQVAMNLLYVNGQYNEALEVFEQVQSRRIGGVRYPKNCFTLALACYYKLDTSESLDSALQLLESAQEYGLFVNRRLLCLVAGLCVNQGRPNSALDILARSSTTTHIAVTSLKVMALSQLDRTEEFVGILRSFTQMDLPSRITNTQRILHQAIVSAEEAMARSEKKELIAEFQRILKSLQEHDQISQETIDAVITRPIEQYEDRRPGQKEKARLAASFSGFQRQSSRLHHQPLPRRGLMDME
ncbi:hypothetical protein Pmani_017964 [Petrolisthes manimaculis]|uniref:Pentatricopeptide repeat-containing protein 2, mitochondrial n=1 Tax=Petrolisthes manimaculis TaxID=1843537 RepID=A0AAE1PLX6_9EUCA|nr:hypothetical protein Pmani_017964 [Petrolisthes manimaculis]